MGGFGSGRRDQLGKGVTEDSLSLDVRRLQRMDLLRAGHFYHLNTMRKQKLFSLILMQVDSNELVLSYQHKGASGQCRDLEYPVGLIRTPCQYGGQRTWFACPEPGCGRRVAKLYLADQGRFACRHCSGLAYSSQRKAGDQRARQRAGKIRRRLEWPPGILNQCASKPKGMHWKTYWRLRAQHDALVQVVLEGVGKRLGMVEARLNVLLDDLAARK